MIRHQQTNHLPFYLFFNIMLWILQGMNIYWFMVRENCFLSLFTVNCFDKNWKIKIVWRIVIV